MAESTSSTTLIDAAPEQVLAVIADLGAYPQWAGGVKKVVVTERAGDSPSEARFTVDNGPIKDTYTLAYTWDTTEQGTGTVSWTLLRSAVLTRLDGSYTLTAEGRGTAVRYDLAVDLAIPMPGMLKRKAQKTIVTTALRDLAERVSVA
jgi:ribosome-associated toxin RatA of RatAB toxin-antitoxin module